MDIYERTSIVMPNLSNLTAFEFTHSFVFVVNDTVLQFFAIYVGATRESLIQEEGSFSSAASNAVGLI